MLVSFSLAVAALSWFLVFGLKVVNFWLGMSLSVSVLSAWAWRFGGPPWRRPEWSLANVLLGLASAGVLYGVFLAGDYLSRLLFDFAGPGVAAVYSFGTQADPRLIALILLFVTSPGEEIYWRGYVQRRLGQRWGGLGGWLGGAALYAAVHLSSGNPMLVLAALVAGLFWGLVFAWRRSLVPVVVSHALWALLIFVIRPVC